MRRTWNADNTAELIKMWTKGKRSAAQIAKVLSMTRSAVIGKAHRLGLKNRSPLRNRKTIKQFLDDAALKSTQVAEYEEVQEGILLEDTKHTSCMFTTRSQRKPYLFCGKAVVTAPWCEVHEKIVTTTYNKIFSAPAQDAYTLKDQMVYLEDSVK